MSDDKDTEVFQGLSVKDLEALRDSAALFVESIIGEEPYDYQEDFMEADQKRKAFVSGRQVGKSRTAAWIALWWALTRPNQTVLITSPSQRQSSELFNQLKSEIRQSKLPRDMWGADRETRTVIEFKHGSRVLALPTSENIRTYTANLIIVDEASFVENRVFHQILTPMLATTDGPLLMFSTPYRSDGYLYDAFHGNLEDNYYTKQVATWENPLVSEKYIENQRKQLTDVAFKREIRGEFATADDKFFNINNVEARMYPQVEREVDALAYCGIDPSRGGPDPAIIGIVDQRGNVFELHEVIDPDIPKIADRVMEKDRLYEFARMGVDETGVGGGVADILKREYNERMIEEINFSMKTKGDLYSRLKTWIQQDKIQLPDDPALHSEFESIIKEYTAAANLKIDHTENGSDDRIDAISIALEVMQMGRGPRNRATKAYSFGVTPAPASADGVVRPAHAMRSQKQEEDVEARERGEHLDRKVPRRR